MMSSLVALALPFLANAVTGKAVPSQLVLGPWRALHSEEVTAVLLVEVDRGPGGARRASAEVHRAWRTTGFPKRLRLPQGFSPAHGSLLLIYVTEPVGSATESLDRLAGSTLIEDHAVAWLASYLDVGGGIVQSASPGESGQAWFAGVMGALLEAPASVADLVARDLAVGQDPLGRRQADDWSRWLVVHEHLESSPARAAVARYLFRELALRPGVVLPTYLELLESDPRLRGRILRDHGVRFRFRELEDAFLDSLEKTMTVQDAKAELDRLGVIRKGLAEAEAEAPSVTWVADSSGLLRPRRHLDEQEP